MKVGRIKSNFTTINAGVPQGTIFGPIGFAYHINDLCTTCDHVKPIDDCTIWEAFSTSYVGSSLQTAQTKWHKGPPPTNWHKKKTPDIPPITINERQIEQVNWTRLLGVAISHDLTWQLHINEITKRASRRLNFIILLKRAGVEPLHLVKIYVTIISPSSSTPGRCGIRAY